jgi:hypothetical protein
MKQLKNYLLIGLFLGFGFAITGCDDEEEPEEEESVEVITDLTLIFTARDGSVVTAQAIDPDGAGSLPLEVQGPINLQAGIRYTLTFDIINGLDPNDPEDIGEEIEEEDDEHQIFFAFTEGAFTGPEGNGNIDNVADPVWYEDEDDNGCHVGLITDWDTGAAQQGSSFRVRLQHQPDIKSCATGSETGAQDGDTDFDVEFVLNIG